MLVPLSPLLIFGLGPVPAYGIAGGGMAVVLTTLLMLVILAWYVLSGRCVVRLVRARLRWTLSSDILRVGGIGAVNTLKHDADHGDDGRRWSAPPPGRTRWRASARGARLEYLLIPLVFGLGAPLVAMVGTNIGAGQSRRALRIAVTGGALAFAVTEAIGLAAAAFPVEVAFAVRQANRECWRAGRPTCIG